MGVRFNPETFAFERVGEARALVRSHEAPSYAQRSARIWSSLVGQALSRLDGEAMLVENLIRSLEAGRHLSPHQQARCQAALAHLRSDVVHLREEVNAS